MEIPKYSKILGINHPFLVYDKYSKKKIHFDLAPCLTPASPIPTNLSSKSSFVVAVEKMSPKTLEYPLHPPK